MLWCFLLVQTANPDPTKNINQVEYCYNGCTDTFGFYIVFWWCKSGLNCFTIYYTNIAYGTSMIGFLMDHQSYLILAGILHVLYTWAYLTDTTRCFLSYHHQGYAIMRIPYVLCLAALQILYHWSKLAKFLPPPRLIFSAGCNSPCLAILWGYLTAITRCFLSCYYIPPGRDAF